MSLTESFRELAPKRPYCTDGSDIIRKAMPIFRDDAASPNTCQQRGIKNEWAGAVLIGVALNALLGWWWRDPLAGLVILYYGRIEGRAAGKHARIC
jgi:hypothetical protein